MMMLKRENKYPGKVVVVVNKITLLSTKHTLSLSQISPGLHTPRQQATTQLLLPPSTVYGKEVKGGKGNLSSTDTTHHVKEIWPYRAWPRTQSCQVLPQVSSVKLK